MRKETKKLKTRIATTLLAVAVLAAAAAGVAAAEKPAVLSFGVAPGPYGDMILKAVKPGLEKKGYVVKLVQFQDYVQPNLALANKETTANLFQHQPYLEKFSADKGLKLSPVIKVPTVGLGLYSNKTKSISQLKDGDEVTLAQDPTNLARALRFLQKLGLLKIKANVDPTKASVKDIAENPRKLRITPLEAAQIPRSLDGVAAGVVNGNYAIASGLKLSEALALEELDEGLKNLIAVRTEDLDKQFVKDIVEVVHSEEFFNAIESPANIFSSFQKPDWYVKQWGSRMQGK